MLTATTPSAADADLNALLAGLGLDEIEDEPKDEIKEIDLEAAVKSAESQEVVNAHYNAAPDVAADAVAPIDPLSDPASLLGDIGSGSGDAPVTEAPKKEKKAKAPKVPKPPKEKKAPVERKHYASVTERLTDRMGDKLDEYTVLELEDAELDDDALKAKQSELMEKFAASGVKVQKRTTFLIEYASGKSPTLNKIATTALTLLKSGTITTGDKGTLFLELSKEYKPSSAATMGNNTLLAMALLKIVVKTPEGYAANPSSLYAMKLNSMLGLA